MYKTIEIKPIPEKTRHPDVEYKDVLLQHEFTLALIAPKGSGKTTSRSNSHFGQPRRLCRKLCRELDRIVRPTLGNPTKFATKFPTKYVVCFRMRITVPRCLAAGLLALGVFTGCESTDSGGGSVSGSAYYGVGFSDPWYYGGYPMTSTSSSRRHPPAEAPVHPEQPIYRPPAPRPTPMPSIPAAPRPMPRPAGRR